MLMRIVWPVLNDDGVLDLIAEGWHDFDNVVHRLGFLLGGSPKDWEVVPGSRFANDPEFRVVADVTRVLTCVVPVVEAYREEAA